ncbi:7646_t:CDS:2, partial [Dentiscutata heterogama]
IRKKCNESCLEDGKQVICKVSWECGCAGNYQPKKILNPEEQRNLVNSHNYPMSPAPSITISNYRRLGEDMLEFIDFCITYGTTGARNIEQLLK